MNPPRNIARARKLRQEASLPEQRAWQILRKLRPYGLAIRRQVPIAGLTVDFAIRSKRLVIEIDGPMHALPHVVEKDAERDARLEAAGWHVLRISHEYAGSAEHLVAAIESALSR
ncbi:MAG: endonuclease domain-containing protein [Hyphomonadaceae bacterium]|nr:endonuclease domain-containing protein [Hyphomonadaceae bacterium]